MQKTYVHKVVQDFKWVKSDCPSARAQAALALCQNFPLHFPITHFRCPRGNVRVECLYNDTMDL